MPSGIRLAVLELELKVPCRRMCSKGVFLPKRFSSCAAESGLLTLVLHRLTSESVKTKKKIEK